MKQRSPEWDQIRAGKITGTKLKGLLGRTSQEWIYRIAAENITGGETGENAMQRGVRLESEALEFFKSVTGHDVREVGFIESSNPGIGMSPDGVIYGFGDDKDKVVQAVEIKCLAGWKHLKAFVEASPPKEYEAQILQYFICNEDLQVLHFVLYHDLFPIKSQMVHLVIHRSDVMDKITNALGVQKEALKEVFRLILEATN